MKKLLFALCLLISSQAFANPVTNRVVWFAIPAVDMAVSETFYGTIFPEWKFTRSTMDGYEFSYVTSGDDMIGEIVKEEQRTVGGVAIYFMREDIVATYNLALANGATVFYPPMNLGEEIDEGAIAGFIDPSGNRIGLYQTAPLKQ